VCMKVIGIDERSVDVEQERLEARFGSHAAGRCGGRAM
jgi:hypothetical protein